MRDNRPVRHLNNAGTSWPKPPEVFTAAAELSRLPPQGRGEAFERVHAELCGQLGVSTPERLLLTSSCTSALSVAIADLPWREGDRILTSSLEHHAMARPLLKLERERGVLVERSPYTPGKPFDLDWARQHFERGGVRLLACTAASNVTGELLPLEQMGALAHRYDALYLMDAAQTAGVLPLDFEGSGADIITLAGHKGPLAPWGIGLLWAASPVQFESPWARCEIPEDGGVPDCSSFPSYCDLGSVNLSAAGGLAAGLSWLAAHPEAMQRARRLASQTATWVDQQPRLKLFGSAEAQRTATVALAVDGLALEDTEAAFAAHDLIVRAGSHCAPWALEAIGSPAGCLRVSFGAFSKDEDFDLLVAALTELSK